MQIKIQTHQRSERNQGSHCNSNSRHNRRLDRNEMSSQSQGFIKAYLEIKNHIEIKPGQDQCPDRK